MTTTDYLLNGAFVALVVRQALRERRLDRRAFLLPLVAVFFVAQAYLRAIPANGNDLAFIALLACTGSALGVLAGRATRLRPDGDGVAARVGWLAGALLVGGISARMGFAFAIGHGAAPAVRSFSIAHDIGAAAWPVAFVSMAVCEVVARLVTVAARSRKVCAA